MCTTVPRCGQQCACNSQELRLHHAASTDVQRGATQQRTRMNSSDCGRPGKSGVLTLKTHGRGEDGGAALKRPAGSNKARLKLGKRAGTHESGSGAVCGVYITFFQVFKAKACVAGSANPAACRPAPTAAPHGGHFVRAQLLEAQRRHAWLRRLSGCAAPAGATAPRTRCPRRCAHPRCPAKGRSAREAGDNRVGRRDRSAVNAAPQLRQKRREAPHRTAPHLRDAAKGLLDARAQLRQLSQHPLPEFGIKEQRLGGIVDSAVVQGCGRWQETGTRDA